MENIENLSQQELKIQGLVDGLLKVRASENHSSATRSSHLDEDTLSAFVDGVLNQREATPVVKHLVDCSFCRHITADLVRLDLAFAASVPAAIIESKEPSRVSEVLSGLLSKIFGTSDGAVFAHSEDEKPEENRNDDKKDSQA